MKKFYKGNYEKEAAIETKDPRKDRFWIVGHFMPDGDARTTKDLGIKYWTFNNSEEDDHPDKEERRSTEVTLILKGKVRGFIEEEVDGSLVRSPVELEAGEYVVIPYGVRNNLIQEVVDGPAVGITIKVPNGPKFEPYKFPRNRKSKPATAL
jgi:hypothetical protein